MNGTRESMMNIRRSMPPDPGMAVLVVVPGEEISAESFRVLQPLEPVRELRPIFQRRELCLRERFVIPDIGLECDFVIPRSASRNATGVEAIEDPSSEWIVSWFRSMRGLRIVSLSSLSASTADSCVVRSHPTE